MASKMKTTLTAILALAAGAALAEGDLTVSAWILPRGLVPGAPIVVATSDAEARGDGFGLFLGDDGALRAYAGAASAAENVAAGPRPPEGEWSHVCLVCEGGAAWLYLDGVAQGAATNAADRLDDSLEVFIGDDGFLAFDGDVVAVDFLDEALSPGEVAALAGVAEAPRPMPEGLAATAANLAKTAARAHASAKKPNSIATVAERLRATSPASRAGAGTQRLRLRLHTPLE